jgi:hypothetical protein
MPDLKEWGIYVYFAADVPAREMQLGAVRNLQALASAGSNHDVGITAMMDLPGKATQYYVIPEKPNGQTNWDVVPDRFLPNVNSASIQTICDFLEWSHLNCPAKQVALVFWGHGYAIDDFDPTIQQQDLSQSADAANQNMGRTPRRIATGFPGKRGQTLTLLFDSTHDAVLNNRDFGSVLGGFKTSFRGGEKIQVLGLDCCNMAMAEVMSELQDYAEYAVAAETELPFKSWLSAPMLKNFLDTPRVSAEDLARDAVDYFINSFARQKNEYFGLSVCKLEKCKGVEGAVKTLASELSTAIDEPQNRAAINKAWFSDVSFLQDGIIDLSSFCYFLANNMSGVPAVRDAANKVRDAVREAIVHSRFAPASSDNRIELSTGMAIWFPPWIQFPSVNYIQIQESKDYFFNGYPQTRFAQATGWNRFLRKLLQLTQGQ